MHSYMYMWMDGYEYEHTYLKYFLQYNFTEGGPHLALFALVITLFSWMMLLPDKSYTEKYFCPLSILNSQLSQFTT